MRRGMPMEKSGAGLSSPRYSTAMLSGPIRTATKPAAGSTVEQVGQVLEQPDQRARNRARGGCNGTALIC